MNQNNIDLNKLLFDDYVEDPGLVKINLFNAAFKLISEEITNESGDFGKCEIDLHNINYSHYCYELGWPDLQDGGLFEQIIEDAGAIAIEIYCGQKPTWKK